MRKIDKTDGLIRTKSRGAEKTEIFCRLAEAAVQEGVIWVTKLQKD